MSIVATLFVITCAFATSSEDAEPNVEPAPEPVATEPDPARREAWLRTLTEAEDWSGLRTESLRWSFDATEPDWIARARFWEAWALLQSGEDRAAILRFARLHEDAPPSIAPFAGLAAARAWRGLEPDIAVRRYTPMASMPDPFGPAATLGLAWSHADLGQFDAARTVLGPSASPELATLLERPRWRRAGVAAALSGVVPGAGQLYAGAPREALAAFLVVGGLATGTVLLALDERPGSAAVVGAIGGTFWLGNLYGAADAAARFNRRRRAQATHAIEAMEAPVFPDPLQ